jgi:hypothetical protein
LGSTRIPDFSFTDERFESVKRLEERTALPDYSMELEDSRIARERERELRVKED